MLFHVFKEFEAYEYGINFAIYVYMNFEALFNETFNRDIIFLAVALTGSLFLTWLIKLAIKFLIPKLAKYASKNNFQWDDILLNNALLTKSWFIFLWIFIPILWTGGRFGADEKTLEVVEKLGKFFLVFATSAQVIIWGMNLINQWKANSWAKKKVGSTPAMGLMFTTLQGFLIVSVVLIALSNLGINIGALVAGLGIGGIAVALAAQNVLGDFLASLSIVIDKPFVNGDFIVAGKEEGNVENIGIKTTRVRSISGEELIFSNKDLLESRIRNYKRMWRRRVVHKFTISLFTPESKLRQISAWIKEMFPKYEKLTFDRCHFTSFGQSAFNFELVFWVEDADYNLYMDLQQNLLFDIYSKLSKEDVQLGLPTSNIHIDAAEKLFESQPSPQLL